MQRILELHLLPRWRAARLNGITPLAIETWALKIRDRGLSGKRVNDIVSCLRTMLKEAHREGRLTFDPHIKGIVRALGSAPVRRGTLTLDEARLLLSQENIKTAWKGHTLYRAVNMTAAATGMRQGEILVVTDQDSAGLPPDARRGPWRRPLDVWGKLSPDSTRRRKSSWMCPGTKKLSVVDGSVVPVDAFI